MCPGLPGILERELDDNGELAQFAHLVDTIEVVDFAEFGLPQRRKRCIAGCFPYELLMMYRRNITRHSLGDVLRAFSTEGYSDFLYGMDVPFDHLSDHIAENELTAEEIRLNLEAKVHHPVYNGMQFPDSPDRPARTVTATCTKVSRESIIIEGSTRSGSYRRLTIRERACLQGFPANFGIFASSYSTKIKLIGNALPPTFAYYVACAMQGMSPGRLRHTWEQQCPVKSNDLPQQSPPGPSKYSYPKNRRFRAAIPGLRFKSGIRFQLSNTFIDGNPRWALDFRFGTPKDIRILNLNQVLFGFLESHSESNRLLHYLGQVGFELREMCCGQNPHRSLQLVWSHRRSGVGPFEVVDELGRLAKLLRGELVSWNTSTLWGRLHDLLERSLLPGQSLPNASKLHEERLSIYGGIALGCWFNQLMGEFSRTRLTV